MYRSYPFVRFEVLIIVKKWGMFYLHLVHLSEYKCMLIICVLVYPQQPLKLTAVTWYSTSAGVNYLVMRATLYIRS